MTLAHVAAIRNSLADLVVDAIDAGASAGRIEFWTSGDSEVATCPFGDPAFGAAAGGTATANSITSDTNATGGTIAKFVIFDSNNNEVFRGTVTGTGGGGDIEITSTAIGAGDTVSVSSLTYSASV